MQTAAALSSTVCSCEVDAVPGDTVDTTLVARRDAGAEHGEVTEPTASVCGERMRWTRRQDASPGLEVVGPLDGHPDAEAAAGGGPGRRVESTHASPLPVVTVAVPGVLAVPVGHAASSS
jgi:hypothetical protein